LLFAGCAPTTLAGVWTGEWECEVENNQLDEELEFEVTLSLSGDGTIFAGELELQAEWEGDFLATGDTGEPSEGDHELEAVYEVEVGLLTPDGPQSFELESECDDFKWEFESDDILEGCENWGDSDFEVDWDGENTISHDDQCEGTLIRP
jgi:hypothetical protein